MIIPDIPIHIKSTYDAYTDMMLLVQKFARKHSLNSAEALVVLLLGDEIMRPSDVKDSLLVVASNVSYTLAGLEERKLLSRIDDPKDKRCHFIKLTDEGLRLCSTIRVLLDSRARREAA